MSDYSHRFKTLETNLVHAGSPRPNVEGAVVTPIFQSANYLMGDESSYGDVRYIRLSNSPNHLSLQARLAVAESGEAAQVFSSGMAAITTTLLSFVGAGDHVLTQRTLYGGTQGFLDEDAPRFGISHTAIDTQTGTPDDWRQALKPETKVIVVESISNPLIEVGNLKAVVAFAREHELLTVIDNTFASPVNFRPIEIGIDVVMHSATKYLNGHSDLVAGAVIGSAANVEKIRHLMLHLGGSMDPNTAFLFERGLKTLALRVAKQNSNAARIAAFLAAHDKVEKVNYCGLPTDPGHRFASELFDGFGGMLSFYTGDPGRSENFLSKVRIPLHAASLGGVESLVVRPARSSHLGLTPEARAALGITDDLIRVSIGIEEADELIEDFDRALS